MFGYLIQKLKVSNSWSKYVRVVLAVEVGYSVEILKSKIFSNKLIDAIQEITEGSMVRFSGYNASNSYGTYFRLENIAADDFPCCNNCLAPLYDVQCQGCFNEPCEKISGIWKIAQKEQREYGQRFIFTQDENVLGYACFSSSPFHDVCMGLKDKQMVILNGWRDVNRHSKLKMIKGLEKKSPTSAEGNVVSSSDIIIENQKGETSNKRQPRDFIDSGIHSDNQLAPRKSRRNQIK